MYPTTLLTIVTILLVGAISSHSAEISRTPPPEFELLEPFLTPIETVQSLPTPPTGFGPAPSTETVLTEQIILVDESGKTMRLAHIVLKALNESGVKSISESSIGFDHDRERIHLISAARSVPTAPQSRWKRKPFLPRRNQNRSPDFTLGVKHFIRSFRIPHPAQ